jgi:hypothetical protein
MVKRKKVDVQGYEGTAQTKSPADPFGTHGADMKPHAGLNQCGDGESD